jgi:uncharacterized membrane protein YccC
MRPASRFTAPDLARLPIVVNASAISLSEGIRAGLSVAVIIALSEYLAFQPLREAALAALLTCICDPGGPIRRRIPVLLSFALIGAAVTAGYGLLRDFGPIVALPLGVFGLFCSSFVRIYGQAPQQLGALLSTVQILSLDRGNPSMTEAGILAAAFIGGALWAILLTMVIWRIYPFLPARRAVAEAYRKLSELVRDLHTLVQLPTISDAEWEAHARIHRRAARRDGYAPLPRRRQQPSRPGRHPAGNGRPDFRQPDRSQRLAGARLAGRARDRATPASPDAPGAADAGTKHDHRRPGRASPDRSGDRWDRGGPGEPAPCYPLAIGHRPDHRTAAHRA